MQNEQSTLPSRLELSVDEAGPGGKLSTLAGPEVKIYLSREQHYARPGSDAIGVVLAPHLTIRELGYPVYCYLLRLNSSFAIQCEEGEIVYRPEEHRTGTNVVIPLTKGKSGWGLDPKEYEAFSYFKLLVTTEPLHYEQFLQTAIGETPFRGSWQRLRHKNDWCSLTMRLTIVRRIAAIGAEQTVDLPGGQLTILPSRDLQGEVCLVNAYRGANSQDPIHQFPLLATAGSQMLSFHSRDAEKGYNVLEIVGLAIMGPNPELRILLSTTLGSDERIVPYGFTGRDFLPVGTAAPQQDGRILVTINHFPEPAAQNDGHSDLVPNPFNPEDQQHYSLYTAYKVAFFRTPVAEIR